MMPGSMGLSLGRAAGILVVTAGLAAATTAQPSAADHVLDLSFNADLAAQGFPSPLLRATVNGQVVWFLMDTGASIHTLAAWFVTAAHLPTHESTLTLVGSTGATAKAREASPFQLQTRDGTPFGIHDAVVVDFPAIFADQKIAGLLSPQLLASPGQAAVLNLQTPSIGFGPFSVEVAKLGLTAAAATTGTHVCPTQDPAVNGRTYGVPVTVAGIPADMTADTGATSTTVASTRIARALASRAVSNSETQGVGGDAQKAKTVAGVTVVRAGVARKADVLLAGSSGGNCGVDGLLGMDALKGCTLVLAEKTMGIGCGGS
jgi:predicted aspartyl protease